MDEDLGSGSGGEVVPMAWMPSPTLEIEALKQNEPEAEGNNHVLVGANAAEVSPMSSLQCGPPGPTENMNFMTLAEAAAEEATSALYQDLDSAWSSDGMASANVDMEEAHNDEMASAGTQPAIDCSIRTILNHLCDLSHDPVSSSSEHIRDRCHHQHKLGPSRSSVKSRSRTSGEAHNCFTSLEENMSPDNSLENNEHDVSLDNRQDFLDVDTDRSSNSNDAWDPLNPYGLFNLPEPANSLRSSNSRRWNINCALQRARDGFGIFNLSQGPEGSDCQTAAAASPPAELFETPDQAPRSQPSSSLEPLPSSTSVCLRNLLEENDCTSRPFSFLHYPDVASDPWAEPSEGPSCWSK
ncbi:unnamed protein product, partial [Candidula unifasciata]